MRSRLNLVTLLGNKSISAMLFLQGRQRMKKDQTFVKPTVYGSRIWVFSSAFTLALVWYGMSIWLLSGTTAQVVAIGGALVLAAGLPIIRTYPKAEQTPQAQVLAGLPHEVWVINRDSGKVAYRNHLAAARVTAKNMRDIVPEDHRRSVATAESSPVRCDRCAEYPASHRHTKLLRSLGTYAERPIRYLDAARYQRRAGRAEGKG